MKLFDLLQYWQEKVKPVDVKDNLLMVTMFDMLKAACLEGSFAQHSVKVFVDVKVVSMVALWVAMMDVPKTACSVRTQAQYLEKAMVDEKVDLWAGMLVVRLGLESAVEMEGEQVDVLVFGMVFGLVVQSALWKAEQKVTTLAVQKVVLKVIEMVVELVELSV